MAIFSHHPLDFVPTGLRRRLFFVFLALTASGFVVFQFLDTPLRTQAAPSGIVSFELAGSVARASEMMDSWDANARLNNAFGLGFDFLFMPVYAIALSLGTLLAGSRRGGVWPGWGNVLGWSAFAAVTLDAIENAALFSILRGAIQSPYPQLAAGCATVKFALILLCVFYGVLGWLWPAKNL